MKSTKPAGHTERQWQGKVAYRKFECYYCRKPLLLADATKDHVVPLSRGGSDTIANIEPACITCNLLKGQMTEEEFREERRAFSTEQRKLTAMSSPDQEGQEEKEEIFGEGIVVDLRDTPANAQIAALYESRDLTPEEIAEAKLELGHRAHVLAQLARDTKVEHPEFAAQCRASAEAARQRAAKLTDPVINRDAALKQVRYEELALVDEVIKESTQPSPNWKSLPTKAGA